MPVAMPSARRAVRAIHRAALLLALGCLAAAVARGRAQPAAARRVVIGASGDVLFHTRVVASARASGGFDHTLSGLRSIVTDAEIAFANLETPLSTEHAPMRGDPPRLGAPPEAAGALARAGIDVLSVANNHAWDQRAEGLVETVAALEAAGIASVGAAPDEEDAPGPIVIERAGVRVAFVAFTDVLQGHPGTRRPPLRVATWDERRARRALERARARADLVVASMHWGLGYRHDDRSEQRSAAAALVRHGADLVLGHGPHVLQRVERVSSPRGEALVVYSLGNLVSNQGYLYRRGVRERSAELPLREPATRDGVWLRAGLELRDGRVAIGGVEAIPLWTHNNHWDVERRRVPPDVRVLPHRDVDDDALRAERRAAIEAVLGPVVNLL